MSVLGFVAGFLLGTQMAQDDSRWGLALLWGVALGLSLGSAGAP